MKFLKTMLHKISFIILFIILSLSSLNAQFNLPFIINDKDGYTNLREQPNGKSKIVGKVYKNQIFLAIGEPCEDNPGYDPSNNWVYVATDDISGYIYSRNIMQLYKLPPIKLKGNFKLSKNIKETIISGENDSIRIIMRLQSFNEQNHEGRVYGGSSDIPEENIKYHLIENEIKEVEIFCKNKKTVLLKNEIKNYCDVISMSAYIGYKGEIYLGIGGGGDAAQYGVWFSIVNGEIKYTCLETYCW
jgi:hypothetical protein